MSPWQNKQKLTTEYQLASAEGMDLENYHLGSIVARIDSGPPSLVAETDGWKHNEGHDIYIVSEYLPQIIY